jgi:hypothetical protein
LLLKLGRVFDGERPDRVVVQGDTATAMVGALAAYYRSIPVSHVEAGLRSGDIHHPWPEEANCRIISTVADQHFAPTETAAEALRRENTASMVSQPDSRASESLPSPATGARISAKAWRRSRAPCAESPSGTMSR